MVLSDVRRSPDAGILAILTSAAEVVHFGPPDLGSSERPVEATAGPFLYCFDVAMRPVCQLSETHPLLREKIELCPLVLSQLFQKARSCSVTESKEAGCCHCII